MYPPVFELVAASTDVKNKLGTDPVRVYLFGEAPPNSLKPYCVWQSAYGQPQNFLGQLPDMDFYGVQVEVFAKTADAAREAAQPLRDAFEPAGHIVRWGGEFRDPDTKDYVFSFDVEFFKER